MSRRELVPEIAFQKAFGQYIKGLRESVGWTQGDLYQHSRVSVYQIGRIENGHEGPKFQTLLALAQALGKRPAELFEFKYPYKLNKTFQKAKIRKPGITDVLHRLFEDNFFAKAKGVSDVIKTANEKFGKQFKSADVSGSLLILANAKKLVVVRRGNKNLYQNK